MQKYLSWMDSRSRIVKILLCLWILDYTWAVYRIGGAIANKNVLHIVLGVLWVIAASTVGWILDIVWIVLFNRIFWFKESK